MNTSSFNYLFGIDGNFTVKMEEMNRATSEFTAQVQKSQGVFDRFVGMAAKVDILSNGITKMAQALGDIVQPGIALNTSMTDLQAVTGVTGEGLKQIESYARDTAKAFGIDAAGAVESYKLILGQLSPELAKSPVALKAMGEHVATLSKLMGGDATAAAETLNTAMNQYGVDLSDPIKASEEMARMMNVMAAAGQEGSAELPQIKEALEQAGMAAKGAGVSFEEANAAIQVLDKAGKKGSEGGIALRNVIATLSQGRFIPKDVQKELKKAGINVTDLADRGKSLKERLELLRPVMNDAALFAKLFGKENTNAAMALVGGTEEVGRYTEAIQGTQSANDQAAVVMEGFAERQARIRQQIEDFKITIFNATGDVSLWAGALSDALIPLAQLMPLLSGMLPIVKGVSIWIFQGAKGLFLFGKGALTALVGVSGSGKTSVLRIVSRLYDYDGGSILIDGKDIKNISTDSLFKKTSIVFQDVTLFNTSILENIRIGRESATDEEVKEAAILANCLDFIEKLPDGFNTKVGENGTELSGGERQRLSIARAFLKDAPILILDEISANLDVDNEKKIQDSLNKLIKNKTVIIISHRLKSIENVDKIVVIDDGRVETAGTHKQLLEQSKVYKNLIEKTNLAEEFSY